VVNDNLFGGKKLVKIYDFFSAAALAGDELDIFISKLSKSSNATIFIEEKLDKRKSETKKLLANKNIKVLQFEQPQGPEFKKWAENRAQKYGLKFGRGALDLLTQRLGIDAGDFGGVTYDLWQADSELNKLATFSKEVSAAEVADLVSENVDDNIFKITNAIGDKNKQLATKYLMDYMDRLAGTDEKTKVIGLSGLLADQFRGILLVQDLIAKPAAESEIKACTAFYSAKSFRCFKKAGNPGSGS